MSKEAIVNAGQSLEDPLMRVSLRNTSCPKYTSVQPRKQGDKDKLSHTIINNRLRIPSCFQVYFMPRAETLYSFRVNVWVKHARNQIQNSVDRCSVNGVTPYSHVFMCWTLCLVAFCRSSPSLVCVRKPSSVLRLTTSCSTESCSRSTPSNCSPPTASSTTSVSFSPPRTELTTPKSLVSSFSARLYLFLRAADQFYHFQVVAKEVLELNQKYDSVCFCCILSC